MRKLYEVQMFLSIYNIVLYPAMLTHSRVIYARFSSTTAVLSSCDRDSMASKPRVFTVGSFRGSWPTPYLNLKIWNPSVFRSQTCNKNGWNARCIRSWAVVEPMVNWRERFPRKGTGIQHCIKTLCQPSSVCARTLDNLQPFKITHLLNPEKNWHTIYYGIHFSLLVNARHIIRYHLENDTCFTPKKYEMGKS